MKRYKSKKKDVSVSLQEFKEVPTANNLIFKGGPCTILFYLKNIKLSTPSIISALRLRLKQQTLSK